MTHRVRSEEPYIIKVEPASAEIIDRYPVAKGMRISFPLHMWAHGGNTEYPIPMYDSETAMYSVGGWVLMQMGVQRGDLDYRLAEERPFEVQHHVLRTRYMRLPRGVSGLIDRANPIAMAIDLGGYTGVAVPWCLTKRPDPHGIELERPSQKMNILMAINATRRGRDSQGVDRELSIEERTFWCREVLRTCGIGLQVIG